MSFAIISITSEIRWYIPGSIPEEIWSEFYNHPESLDFPERNDQYFRFRKSHSAGLKIRENRLELKVWIEDTIPIKIFNRNAGIISRWEKHSWETDQELLKSIFNEDKINVSKRRVLLGIIHKSDKLEFVIPDHNFLARPSGCQVELSKLNIEGKAYWSFNLETWNSTDPTKPAIQEYFNLILENKKWKEQLSPHLNSGTACSYPEFLLQF